VESNPYQAPGTKTQLGGDLLGPEFQPRAMEAQFEVVLEDLLAFNLYHHQHSPALRRFFRRLLFVLVLALGMLTSITALYGMLVGLFEAKRWVPLLVMSLVGIGAYLACVPFIRHWGVRKQVRLMMAEGKNSGLYGQHRLSIAPDGIREVVSVGESFRRWIGVERIAVTEDYAFFYQTAVSAYVLPKRAFGDELHFQQFVRSAQIWMEQAQRDGQTM
jgi:hypothetical protein